MRYIKITALVSTVLLIMTGCGQRGPLYSPEDTPEQTPQVSVVTNSSLTVEGV